jgi:DNA modification methylase
MSGIQREERIGGQRLILGDCLEVMPLLGKVDAVVTDPPYGIGFEYNSHDDTSENLEALIAGFVPASRGMARRVVITPGNTNLHKYPAPDWTGAWTWDTTTARGFWGWSQWQPILLYGQDPASSFGAFNGVLRSDRIHFSGGQAKISHAEGRGHTCPKPLAFMNRLLLRFSVDGETILDPFMGSGTTLVACAKLGRKGIGIELDPDYFDIACKRVEEAYKQPDLFVPQPEEKPEQIGMDWGQE